MTDRDSSRGRRFRALLLLTALVAGCNSGSSPAPGEESQEDVPPGCTREDPAASVDVTGVYRYDGDAPFFLRGTITFEQTGDLVRVVDTTYDNSRDRRLEGEATLRGNRLDITLVPKNGDTDYEADITFLFSLDGDTFCVEFSDTNDDQGPMGSYRGVRQ